MKINYAIIVEESHRLTYRKMYEEAGHLLRRLENKLILTKPKRIFSLNSIVIKLITFMVFKI